jgi:hypothetical protein
MNSRKERLEAIKQKSDELNKLADQATAELAEVEKELLESGVGVEAWNGVIRSDSMMAYDEEEDKHFQADHDFRLGFAKINGKWGIVINEYVQISEDCILQGKFTQDESYFLRNAPRDIRIDALPYIDELLAKIESVIEKKTQSLAK